MSAAATLLSAYLQQRPDDAARACETLRAEDAAAALHSVSAGDAAGLLQAMTPLSAARVLAAMAPDAGAPVVLALPVEILAALLRRLDDATAARLLASAPDDLTARLRRLLASPAGTAGALMDPAAPSASADATIGDVRRSAAGIHFLHDVLFVVDAAHHLAGAVGRGALAGGRDEDPVRAVMQPVVASLPIAMPLPVLAALPEWQMADVLPVVDEHRRFAGAIDHRRVRRAMASPDAAAGTDRTMRTLMALGEVYWLGLSGLMQGLATTASSQARPEGGRP
jgi:magnesium transporter